MHNEVRKETGQPKSKNRAYSHQFLQFVKPEFMPITSYLSSVYALILHVSPQSHIRQPFRTNALTVLPLKGNLLKLIFSIEQ
jgi:hypothetical protein